MRPSFSHARALRAVASASVLAVALVACGGGHRRQSDMSSDTATTSSQAGSVRTLPCQEVIGTGPPVSGMHVVLGVVALPASPWMRRALQTARSGLPDPRVRLFAKEGLVIRAGARFRLIVARRLQDRLSIGWGNAGEGHRGSTIAVDACSGPRGARWLAYAGGYFIRDPMCAPLIVAANGQQQQVQIGIGKACAGQQPPVEPTSA
jgi:hypothetical protein